MLERALLKIFDHQEPAKETVHHLCIQYNGKKHFFQHEFTTLTYILRKQVAKEDQ